MPATPVLRLSLALALALALGAATLGVPRLAGSGGAAAPSPDGRYAEAPGLSADLLEPAVLPLTPVQQADAALVERARGIHERVITLDTHADINAANFTADCNYTMRLTTQVNLPKMEEGGLDVAFFIVYTGQDDLTPEGYERAYENAIEKFEAVHRLTEQIAPDRIGLALTPAEVRSIAASGRKVAVIGIENAYPVGTDIGRIEEFYDRGGRYMSLAHNGHSQFSDSNNGEGPNEWLYGGLSELGRQAVMEMNRLGIMIDVSHPSKGSMMQTVGLSKAPVIASHSAVRTLGNHSRNMDDEMLKALEENGGVIMTVAFATYVNNNSPERVWALRLLEQEFADDFERARAAAAAAAGGADEAAGRGGRGGGGGGRGGGGGERVCPVEDPSAQPAAGRGGRGGGRGGRGGGVGQQALIDRFTPERKAEYAGRMAAINEHWPAPERADVSDFVDHIDYAVKLIGIDHVGISSDFDGGGGVDGWSSASETFNVTLELVRRGYTEEQIGKIWSGNLLRVWEEVERVAAGIQSGQAR
jgi:membrane dipeptidase